MSKRDFITVLFSCDCGLEDIPVQVRAREKHEDVKNYVENVIGRAVAHTHEVKSLFKCQRRKMKYLKIPLPPEDDPDPWIGKYNSVQVPKGEDNAL